MTIAGDIATMAEALGRPVDDARTLDVMALIGLPTERSDYREGGVTTTYYVAQGSSVELIFRDGLLDSVIVQTSPGDDHEAYARAEHLIQGLPARAEREQVTALLGEPVSTRKASDRFALGDGFIRFGYAEGAVSDVSLMRRAPGA